MEPQAKIEPVAGILRIWKYKRDDSIHNTGIPYFTSATVRWIDPETIEIMGLSTSMSPSLWRAIMTECKSYNVNKVIFTRYKNGQKIEKQIHI